MPSTKGRSGAQLAREYLALFNRYIERKRAQGEPFPLRRGRLNRTLIAQECGFVRSVFAQNPAVRQRLEELEEELVRDGLIEPGQAASVEGEDPRLQVLERRVQDLEQRLEAASAENRDLRSRLRRYELMEQHLVATGRTLHP